MINVPKALAAAATMVSDMNRMPLPAEAGVMLCALTQNPAPIRQGVADEDAAFERLWRSCPLAKPEQVAEEALAYDESFFRRVRALGDHPAVRDLNAHIDAVVLPALFAHPGAIDRLPAILEAAEMDGGILDI